jgi:Squalene-hopene cyclase C-terminal domain
MFDPYEKWLGIPKDQRPIDFFLLLDLDPDEDDPAVIKKAARKQAERVSQHEDGPHAQASARLLEEIEKARATLVNPTKRKAYEAILRKNSRKDEPEDEEEEAGSTRPKENGKKKGSGKSSRKEKALEKASRVKLWVAIGGAAALLIGVGLAIYFSTEKKKDDNTSSPPAVADGSQPEVAAGPSSGTPKSQPKTNLKTPKNEPPKNEPPKNEPPKNEPPKNEPPKNEPAPKPPVVVGLPRPAERKPPAKVVKLPVPEQAAQDNAEKAIKEEYKALYGKSKNDDLLLAAKLLQPGRENGADPAAWFVLLREARDAAVRAGRPRLAVESIDEIDRWFVIDAFDLKLQALAKITEPADDAAARAVIKVALNQFEEAITADNAVVAQKFLDAADAAARKRKPDNNHPIVMKKRLQELESFQKARVAVAAARETLGKMPDDPEANQVVGKHLCLFEGRWDEGLPLLAKGGKDDLPKTAEQDLTPPADVAAQIAVGDAWWKMSEDSDSRERRWLMERAVAWYELALPKVTGADEAKLTERLTKVDLEDSFRNKRLIPGSFYGREPEDRILLLRESGGTRRTEEAIERGLEWLARHQAANGRWATDAFHLVSKCACTERGEKHDIAGTAFGLLPLLGAGETHKRGRYSQAVQRGLAYLLSQQKPDGRFHDNAYENALATLAVCEAYGMTSDGLLKAQAQAAVNFIVKAQDAESGSWGYSAGTKGDTSVSGWQFSALKAGHYANLSVPAEAFSRFRGFLDQVADPNGLGYGYNVPGAGRATSATGLMCREYLGWGSRHPLLTKGIKQLQLPQNFVTKEKPSFYFLFYATQAMHNAGADAWEAWHPKVRELLIDLQDKGDVTLHQKGSWSPVGDDWAKQGGRLMTTSLSLLILEAYYNYVPFNSHGPTLRRD